MKWFKGRSGSDKRLAGKSTAAAPEPSTLCSLSQPKNVEHAEVQEELATLFVPTICCSEQQETSPTSLRRSPTRESPSSNVAPPSPSKFPSLHYPDIYQNPPASQQQKAPVQGRQELLVKIPDTMVHLIDHQQSVLLASGNFTIEKLVQNGMPVAIFVKVGDDLQWPLVKDMPTTKLDSSHYYFSLRVDPDEEEKSSTTEMLNYGVTFKADGKTTELLKVLDHVLDQYCYFSAPTMLQACEGTSLQPKTTAEEKPNNAVSTAYWTTLAPNIDDYNSRYARAIANGTRHIIRGIFWCSDATVRQLEKGGKFVKKHTNACTEPSSVHPRTMKNMRRAKKITKMSDRVTRGVLTGVVDAFTGYFATTMVKSRAGKKVFKHFPGEVALASLKSFGKIFESLEVAGSNVLHTSSTVTTDAISHKYGDEAGDLVNEGLATAGHLFGAAWTISKLRNAFNPVKVIKPAFVLRTASMAAASMAAAVNPAKK